MQKLSKNVQDALARANEVAEEVFSSMRTIRSFANESEEVSRYADKLSETYKLKLKESVAYAGYVWSNQVLSTYLDLIVFSVWVCCLAQYTWYLPLEGLFWQTLHPHHPQFC